jgi:hypothetical protein
VIVYPERSCPPRNRQKVRLPLPPHKEDHQPLETIARRCRGQPTEATAVAETGSASRVPANCCPSGNAKANRVVVSGGEGGLKLACCPSLRCPSTLLPADASKTPSGLSTARTILSSPCLRCPQAPAYGSTHRILEPCSESRRSHVLLPKEPRLVDPIGGRTTASRHLFLGPRTRACGRPARELPPRPNSCLPGRRPPRDRRSNAVVPAGGGLRQGAHRTRLKAHTRNGCHSSPGEWSLPKRRPPPVQQC